MSFVAQPVAPLVAEPLIDERESLRSTGLSHCLQHTVNGRRFHLRHSGSVFLSPSCPTSLPPELGCIGSLSSDFRVAGM